MILRLSRNALLKVSFLYWHHSHVNLGERRRQKIGKFSSHKYPHDLLIMFSLLWVFLLFFFLAFSLLNVLKSSRHLPKKKESKGKTLQCFSFLLRLVEVFFRLPFFYDIRKIFLILRHFVFSILHGISTAAAAVNVSRNRRKRHWEIF